MLRKLDTNPSKFFWGRPNYLRDNLPRNPHFWQVRLLDIVLSEYPDKSHNFGNFIFMTSHFSTLFLSFHSMQYPCTWDESNSLPNSSITASSVWRQHPGHGPWLARLNNVPKHGITGSWSTDVNKAGEWLQVDLGEERLLTNLSTQGRPSADQWVRSYNISFSSDSVKWEPYKENNVVKVCDRDFISKHDSNTGLVEATSKVNSRRMAQWLTIKVLRTSKNFRLRNLANFVFSWSS